MTPPVQRIGLALSHVSQFKECICCGFFESCSVPVLSVGFILQMKKDMAFLKDFCDSCACPSDWHSSPSKLRLL